MNKKIFTILTVMLITTLMSSTVSAAPAVKLDERKLSWDLGSLIADGYLFGLGNLDVTVVLDAWGRPEIICTKQGETQDPDPSRIHGIGFQFLPGDDELRKNGKSPFDVTASEPTTLPGSQGGCPDDSWTAVITFVYWDYAKISVYLGLDLEHFGPLLLEQEFTCVTTKTGPNDTPSTLDDGTVTCTPQ